MAIIYEKRQIVLGFKDKKPTVFKIAPTKTQKVLFDQVLDEVSASCGVGRAQVKASIEGLLDRMILFMKFGMPVRLGDFGTFKPMFNAKSQENEEDLDSSNVVRRKIRFFPGKRLKELLATVSISTLSEGISTPKSSEGSNGGDDDGGDDDGFIDPTV